MHFLEGNGFSYPVGSSEPYLRAWMTATLPVSISFAFLGYTEFAARLPSVIVGLSTIVVTYLLGKDVGGYKLGLISSAIMSIDFWVISWHTQARMYAHNQLLYILGVWLLFRWYNFDKLNIESKYLALFLPVGFLGYHNHISYLGILPSFGLFLFLGLLVELRHSNWRENILNNSFTQNHLKWGFMGFSIGLIYLIVENIPHWLLGYSPAWYRAERGAFYFLNFLNEISNLLFLFSLGILLVWRKKENWLIPTAFIVPFVVQSLVVFKEPRLILHLYTLYVIIASVPLVYLMNIIESSIKSNNLVSSRSNLISILIAMVLVLSLYSPIQSLEIKDDKPHGFVQGSNHRDPVRFIEQRRSDEDIIISSAPSITGWYIGDIKEIDYDLNYINNENVSGELIDHSIGIRAVQDKAEMKNIISNKTGWIVADDNFYTDYKINTEVREVIIKNTHKIENESWEEVDLYRFE
jgi:4-amino-4-deoxy-L-arabinose transferase-like glycosyltransferase